MLNLCGCIDYNKLGEIIRRCRTCIFMYKHQVKKLQHHSHTKLRKSIKCHNISCKEWQNGRLAIESSQSVLVTSRTGALIILIPVLIFSGLWSTSRLGHYNLYINTYRGITTTCIWRVVNKKRQLPVLKVCSVVYSCKYSMTMRYSI